MVKKRDYKAEYRRRIANAEKRGLSRSQARGHARPGEKPIRPRQDKPDPRLERALLYMWRKDTQKAAAKRAGVSVERLRRFLRKDKLAERKGGRWVFTDKRVREMVIYTDGQALMLKIAGLKAASRLAHYLSAVSAFISSNDIDYLEPYIGQSVRDAKGRKHVFETNPNTLYRLVHAGDEPFEQIYRLIN